MSIEYIPTANRGRQFVITKPDGTRTTPTSQAVVEAYLREHHGYTARGALHAVQTAKLQAV